MSSNDLALSIHGLSKAYTIRHNAPRANTFGEAMMNRMRDPFRRVEQECFWALKDVDLDIHCGDVIGIIGRNGAGKSTLLKILSRITAPTAGKIDLYGRVGSLLEVGTGFHPELTGRENIFLNGAILGMSRGEIRRQFDAIVDFADVEKFIDTPVKRYSSGMYVRLAFAVAAHLEPEILIIDEVLAVGDDAFQRKCLGKMRDIAGGGRTVLFVSHNMTAVEGLCNRAALLVGGQVAMQGDPATVIHAYMAQASAGTGEKRTFNYRHRGSRVSVERVELLVNGRPANSVHAGGACTIRVHYKALDLSAIGEELSVSLMLFSNGQKLANLWTNYNAAHASIAGSGFVDCTVARWPFRSHLFRTDVYTQIGHDAQDWIEEALLFDSYDGDFYDSGVTTNADQGILFLEHEWRAHAV